MFLKKRVLKYFCKICRKAPVLEFLFNKVAGCWSSTFLKRDPWTNVSLEILEKTFFKEHLRPTASRVISQIKLTSQKWNLRDQVAKVLISWVKAFWMKTAFL